MSKRVKQLMVAELSRGLEQDDSCVVVGLGPLDVISCSELRTNLRERGIRLRVLKNRLAAHAFKDVGWAGLEERLSGTSAIAHGEGGALVASKVLVDWERKTRGAVRIQGGVLEGRLLGVEEVRRLATIPSKTELYAMLAGAVAAPVGQIARLVGETVAAVARAVGAVAEKQEQSAQELLSSV